RIACSDACAPRGKCPPPALHDLEAGEERDMRPQQVGLDAKTLDLAPIVGQHSFGFRPPQQSCNRCGDDVQRGAMPPRCRFDVCRHDSSFRGAWMCARLLKNEQQMRSRERTQRRAFTWGNRVSNPGCCEWCIQRWINHRAFPGSEPGGSEINATKAPSRSS